MRYILGLEWEEYILYDNNNFQSLLKNKIALNDREGKALLVFQRYQSKPSHMNLESKAYIVLNIFKDCSMCMKYTFISLIDISHGLENSRYLFLQAGDRGNIASKYIY